MTHIWKKRDLESTPVHIKYLHRTNNTNKRMLLDLKKLNNVLKHLLKVTCKLIPTDHKSRIFVVRARDHLLYIVVVLYLRQSHTLLCNTICNNASEMTYHTSLQGDAVALSIRRRTCDLQIADSSPGWAPLRSGLGQTTYTCVPLSPSSIIWYRPRG